MNQVKNYVKDYEAIISTIQNYIDGSRIGDSEVMRPHFHPGATIIGYFGGGLVCGPIQKLFELIDGNGPATDIEPCYTSIQILETIAVVHLEVKGWSGKVVGTETRTMSDLFNLIKTESGWKISNKMFHLNIE